MSGKKYLVTKNSTFLYTAISLIVIIAIVLTIVTKNKRENYGGPVKKIRRIPRTECHNICEQYYRDCMSKYGHIDAMYCQNTIYTNCIRNCDYTDYHRM